MADDSALLRLQRLRLHEFAGRKMDADLEFADGLNVLLGENGGGKTTLLNVIVALIRGESDYLRAHGVDAEVWCRMGPIRIWYRLVVEARRTPPAGTDLPPAQPAWHVDGTVTKGDDFRKWSWGSAQPRVGCGLWPDAPPTPDPMRFPPAAMAVANTSAMPDMLRACRIGRFDEANECFRALVGEQPPGPLAPRTHATRLGTDDDPLMAWPLQLTSADLREQRWRASDAPWLRGFAEQIRASDIVVQPSGISADRDMVTTSTVSVQVVWPDQTERPAQDDLSFGQKRLFALLWHLNASPFGPILADELTNGFHHSWLALALRELGNRQAIVAVQNPLLLDHLTFDGPADVRRAVTLCRAAPMAAGRAWIWEKPTITKANHLYAAWRRGMTLVSELLLREGLW